jgi:hypothetical protein
MFGGNAARHEQNSPTGSMVFVTSSTEKAPPFGGWLGGIASSDTANDWKIRQALQLDVDAVNMIRHTPTASLRVNTDRMTGPGEGLNQPVDQTGYTPGDGRIVGPGEGLVRVTQ